GGAAVLLSAFAAQANLTTLDAYVKGNGPAVPAGNFVLTSSDSYDVGLSLYVYTYSFTLPSTYSIDTFEVNFAASAGNLSHEVGGNYLSITPAYSINDNNDIGFQYNPEKGASLTVSFDSPYAPTTGTASAQDTYDWESATHNVLVPGVPTVPDGGLTVALLGGSLLGLQMIRRKLVS
ncbi:MAG TPA: VPDSG-CTERM sorting domain-containing protein, partial [Candidatus Saccharimonadales bacterium]|nr:VPDSG-CTERM sorting domain-containing protein [Candidatus Saccharimonadales bacterium]